MFYFVYCFYLILKFLSWNSNRCIFNLTLNLSLTFSISVSHCILDDSLTSVFSSTTACWQMTAKSYLQWFLFCCVLHCFFFSLWAHQPEYIYSDVCLWVLGCSVYFGVLEGLFQINFVFAFVGSPEVSLIWGPFCINFLAGYSCTIWIVWIPVHFWLYIFNGRPFPQI